MAKCPFKMHIMCKPNRMWKDTGPNQAWPSVFCCSGLSNKSECLLCEEKPVDKTLRRKSVGMNRNHKLIEERWISSDHQPTLSGPHTEATACWILRWSPPRTHSLEYRMFNYTHRKQATPPCPWAVFSTLYLCSEEPPPHAKSLK